MPKNETKLRMGDQINHVLPNDFTIYLDYVKEEWFEVTCCYPEKDHHSAGEVSWQLVFKTLELALKEYHRFDY